MRKFIPFWERRPPFTPIEKLAMRFSVSFLAVALLFVSYNIWGHSAAVLNIVSAHNILNPKIEISVVTRCMNSKDLKLAQASRLTELKDAGWQVESMDSSASEDVKRSMETAFDRKKTRLPYLFYLDEKNRPVVTYIFGALSSYRALEEHSQALKQKYPIKKEQIVG